MSLAKPKDRSLIFPFIYGALAFVVIYVVTSGGLGLSFDSERYLVTAHYMQQGKLDQTLRTAFPGSPLFYPISILALKAVGLSEWLTAARIISILSFVVSVIVVFLLGLQIQGKPTAHLSALTMLIFAPMVCVFSYCWSETLYIALSLLFVFTLILFVKAPPGKSTKYFIGITIFSALGFYTRYLGFSMFLTGVWAIWYFRRRDDWQRKLKRTLIFSAGSGVLMLIGFVLYYTHLGSLFGKRIPARFSFFEQLSGFLAAIYHDFLSFGLTFEKYEVLFTGSRLWERISPVMSWLDKIIPVFLVVIVALFIEFVRSSKQFRRPLRAQAVVFSYMAIYGLLLLGITSTMFVEQAGTRFNVPLYPFIVLSVFSVVFHVYRTVASGRTKNVFLGLVILCTAVFWSIQLVTTSGIYQGAMSGSFPAMEHPGSRNRASLKFLQAKADSTDAIVTNIPYKMAFIWPRKVPYQGLHMYTSSFIVLGTKSIEYYMQQLVTENPNRHIYLYLCSKDYPDHIFNIRNVDELDRSPGFFAWKKKIGNEYIFKLADDPKIPQVR
jgi:4-amino-4-deoxy-L-arabinose transferase-like glycosyltransferase